MSYRPVHASTATTFGIGASRIDVYQRSRVSGGWVNVLAGGYELDTL